MAVVGIEPEEFLQFAVDCLARLGWSRQTVPI